MASTKWTEFPSILYSMLSAGRKRTLSLSSDMSCRFNIRLSVHSLVEVTEHVEPNVEDNLRRLLLAFEDWLVREDLLGDAFFISSEQWKKRGENWLNDALYVMVFDGSSIHQMLNYGCDLTEFDDIFESFGFYYEMGHSWNLGIYPVDGYDFTPPPRTTYSQLLRDPRWKRNVVVY